jgi:hypothetical protein
MTGVGIATTVPAIEDPRSMRRSRRTVSRTSSRTEWMPDVTVE